MSDSESLSSVDSDSEWNYIPEFVPDIQKNFQQEVEDYDPTTRASGEAEEEDVVIPYADEPLARQEIISRSTTGRERWKRS